MSDYPYLEQFLGAYFHQDWTRAHVMWQGVVDLFLRSEDRETVRAVTEEIIRLLGEGPGEAALKDRLSTLGSYYDTSESGGAGKWLRLLHAELSRSDRRKSRPRFLR